MSTTLSYGFVKNVDGDKGNVIWDALETNAQSLNDHTHNGSNSARLTSSAVAATTQSISAAGWAVSGSSYRQLVTLTGSLQYDDYQITFKHGTSKETMLLGVERAGATTYYVYCNDNTVTLTAFYVS